jgi:hypothetical protein
MSHLLYFGHSKVRLNRERVKDPCHDDAGRREAPGLGNAGKDAFVLKATRTS